MKKPSIARRVLLAGASALFWLFPENHLLQMTEYSVCSERIPPSFDGCRIVQLSDLHSCRFGRANGRLLRKIRAARPDWIFITGDMVSRTDAGAEVVFRLAEVLAVEYPVYYVIGNHEQALQPARRREFLRRLGALGVRVLDNEKTELCRGGEKIDLYGMWYPLKFYKGSKQVRKHETFGPREMRRTMGTCAAERYSILLTHDPLRFPVYAGWGADLTFSGHVHGGMIRLPGGGGLLSPERSFFPAYSGGLYERNGKRMIVSRGLGNGVFGPRIHNIPEVVAVNLRCAAGTKTNDR